MGHTKGTLMPIYLWQAVISCDGLEAASPAMSPHPPKLPATLHAESQSQHASLHELHKLNLDKPEQLPLAAQ